MNFLLNTDAHKVTHHLQYPPGTEHIYSYLESRGGEHDYTVFFGLRGIIHEYLEPIAWRFTAHDLLLARSACREVFGFDYFNLDGWQRILQEHGGRLPLRICAVPEGTVVPTRNVLMTVENTDPALPWLTNWVETLLMHVWYPTTVCTRSYAVRKLIGRFAEQTGSEVSPFHLNDFGFRGASSREAAARGGAAHLVNFLGTDTLVGIEYARRHYGAAVCGHSVLATEHSTTTAWGGPEHELDFLRHILKAAPPSAIVSTVADSYDYERFVREYIGGALKEQILAREGGKVVVRPDSGDPVKMAVLGLNILWERFGGTVNARGYKVLDPHVGIIYGDGINLDSIERILTAVVAAGFAVENIVFGMGGALLQQLDRDSQRFAIKCSAAKVDGQWRDVFKQPKTDPGKGSKRGRLKLIQGSSGLETVGEEVAGEDLLRPVFDNGCIVSRDDFADIRARAWGT